MDELISLKDRMNIISKTYSAINQYFAHHEGVMGLDFEDAFDDCLERSLQAGDRYEFYLTMREYIARLKNGHS
jgi:hypothetical protein